VIDLSAVHIDYQTVLPELVVTGTLIVVLLLDLVVPPDRRRWLAVVTVAGLAIALIASIPLWGQHRSAFADTVAGDSFAAFFNVLLLTITILTVLISPRYLRAVHLDFGEYYALVLSAAAGMMLLAAATSLMTIFLGIELLSLALYVLCSFSRLQEHSQESGLKYLLLGGFATGFLLYGMALIYGATGSTTLLGIRAFVTASPGTNVLLLLGIGFLSVGLAFKASAAPFHMWTPDVYEGNLKRLLAYSGIAHAGFIFLGILPGTTDGLAASLFYIAAYAAMNFGAFAVVTALDAKGEHADELTYWTGLFYRRPFLATTMTIFMLSLAGIPPTVGFFAKLFVFQALVTAHLWIPLIVGILTTVISLYYYLRVIVVMVTVPEGAPVERERVGLPMTVVVGLSALGTTLMGLVPQVFGWALQATRF
jgi:NADH-quinone oxidoreductase subunit N